MRVHIFRGPGRVFGVTEDATGVNLPSLFAPWSPFECIELRRDEPTAGVDTARVDTNECLDDIERYGFHITITERAIG
jgi:hypothetical protein